MKVAAWEAFRTSENRNSPVQSTFSSQASPARKTLPAAEKIFSGKKRMNPDDRRAEIVRAATDVISEKGFQAMSMQNVADRVGLTESALYHYIHTKSDLLDLVLRSSYDSPEADEFIYGQSAGMDCDGHIVYYFPRFCVNNIVYNLHRPQLVKLFSLLNAEALNIEHPAHEFFRDRSAKHWSYISTLPWVTPDFYDTRRFKHLWMLCMSAMDGLQYRWLMDSNSDLLEEWLAFSEELFPESLWGELLDPSLYHDENGCLLPYTQAQQSHH